MKLRIALGVLPAIYLLLAAQSTTAQIAQQKLEVGALFTDITLDDFRARALPGLASGNASVKGVGGRFAYNLNENFAIDAEGNFFPEAHFGNEEFGQKLQGFVGVKAGVRDKRVGVFAKARPGVMWFGDFSSVGACQGTTFGSSCSVSHEKDFALDLGGVIEFYPSQRAIVRADIGDTIVRYQARTFGVFNNPSQLPADTTHNFQVSIGFGWRF